MKTASVVWSTIFLLCLAAFPVIEYAGGRSCFPLIVPPLFPAQIVPMGIALVAGVWLIGAVVRSLLARRERTWTLGVLAIAVAATGIFWFCSPQVPAFLYGLRDRFVGQVGYTQMREFAKELSQGSPLVDPEGILRKPGRRGQATPEQQKQWDELVARYPFLGWIDGAGTAFIRGGIVTMTWGSALAGHWGFQVAPGGKVKDLEREDRGRLLRVAEDIQFVSYSD